MAAEPPQAGPSHPPPPESVASYSSTGTNDDPNAVNRRANRIFRLLVHEEPLTTKAHLEVVSLMGKLHTAVAGSAVAVSQDTQLTMVCVLLALQRRCTRLRDEFEVAEALAQRAGDGDGEMAAARDKIAEQRRDAADYERTMLLCFVLIVAFDLAARGGVPPNSDRARTELEDIESRLLWDEMSAPARRKRAAETAEPTDDEATDEAVEEEAEEAAGEGEEGFDAQRALLDSIAARPWRTRRDELQWASVLVQSQPAATASFALRCAASLVTVEDGEVDVSETRRLAAMFARSTADQMQASLVKRDGDDEDFVSLGCQSIVVLPTADFDAQIETIAAAAESETGQMVLRDVVSSFVAPSHVVGTRRTLLLPRETGERLAKEFSAVASYAHEIAMIGAESVWTGASFSELAKTCALLAGFAVLTTPKLGSQDLVLRHATAFGGHVHLPFLATPAPTSGPRIVLIPSKATWVLYSLGDDNKPQVLVSARGLQGLKLCLLGFQKVTRA